MTEAESVEVRAQLALMRIYIRDLRVALHPEIRHEVGLLCLRLYDAVSALEGVLLQQLLDLEPPVPF